MSEVVRIFCGDKDKPVITLPLDEANKIAKEMINDLPITKSRKYISTIMNKQIEEINKMKEITITYDEKIFKEIFKDETFMIIDDTLNNIEDFTFEGFNDNVKIVFCGEDMKVESINGGDLFICNTMNKLKYIECSFLNIYYIQPNLCSIFYECSDMDFNEFIPNIQMCYCSNMIEEDDE